VEKCLLEELAFHKIIVPNVSVRVQKLLASLPIEVIPWYWGILCV
jgi:hypothetical protein